MQYQVPQFIEVEDKIFGPLTLKQFIYLAGGGGLCLVFFTLLPLYIAIPAAIPVVTLSVALAFYKINEQPLINTLEHAFTYVLGVKLYLWKQREQTVTKKGTKIITPSLVEVPKLSQNKLKELSWSLNIKDQTKALQEESDSKDFKI